MSSRGDVSCEDFMHLAALEELWECIAKAAVYFNHLHSQIIKSAVVLTRRFRVIRQPKPRSTLKAKLYK